MDHPFLDSIVYEDEAWFVENKVLIQSELLALKQVVPTDKMGIKIERPLESFRKGVFVVIKGIKL